MTCPGCGAEKQTGNFCAACGAALRGECPSCGQAAPPGSSFCPACGEKLAGARKARVQPVWWIAGAAALLVLLFLLLPQRAERAGPAFMADPGVGAPGAGMGGLSADMRTNADRLFNRVMEADAAGNRAEVEQFLPMAIQAYRMVDALDEDGLFHLGVLHLTAEQHEAARATAHEILARYPSHILGLGVAASAAVSMGDREAARDYYQRLIEDYAVESGRLRPEYVDHQPMVEQYRADARAFLER